MKVVVYENGEVKVENSVKPDIKEGYCLFKIKACGICGSDVPRVFAKKSYYYPIVLGHEFSGIVEDSFNKELIGKRACVFPILGCGECEACKNERYANCAHYDYYGSRRDGGMQDYLLIKEENLILLPDRLSYDEGAMAEPLAVTLHAVRKLGDVVGKTVAVYGAGAIGMLLGMWLKSFGAGEVCFFDPDPLKVKFFKSLGYNEMIDGVKYDIVMEASGSPTAVENAIEIAKPEGEIVLVGNIHKDFVLTTSTYSKILRKQLKIYGSWNSDFSSKVNDWKDAIDAIADGKIEPEKIITHRFTIDKANQAFDVIKNREFYNKIMLEM